MSDAPQLRDRIVEFRRVPSADLTPNPKNWRRHPPEQRAAMAEVLERIGIAGAVLAYHSPRLDGALTLIDGHERQEGHEADWPTLILDVTDEEADHLLATFDPLSMLARPDAPALGALLQTVSISNEAMVELLKGLAVARGGLHGDPNSAPDLPATPRTKRDELWLLGDHRLLCGDSTDPGAVTRLVGDEPCAMLLADPPYNVNYRGGSSTKTRTRGDAYPDQRADYRAWLTRALAAGHAATQPSAALHLWHASNRFRDILAALDASGWVDRTFIIWDKGSIKGGLGQASKQYRTQFEPMVYCHKRGRTPRWKGPGNESDIWAVPGPSANPFHPTMKPIALYERSLRNHTTAGETVLELFGGSGTALIAAEGEGRRARLMEVNPGYVDVILQRFADLTGKDPVRADGMTWSELKA